MEEHDILQVVLAGLTSETGMAGGYCVMADRWEQNTGWCKDIEKKINI